MGAHTPPWLGRVEDLSETARYASMTPDERLRCFVDVCELARTIIEERPDRRAVLNDEDPMPRGVRGGQSPTWDVMTPCEGYRSYSQP